MWFNKWHEQLVFTKRTRAEEARRQGIIARFATRIRKQKEHSVFSTWYEKVQDKICARKHFHKMVSRYEQKSEAACFMQWRRCVAALIAEAKEEARQMVILQRFVSKLHRRREHMIFNKWLEFSTESKHQRLVMTRFLSKMRNRNKLMWFNKWHTWCESCFQKASSLNSLFLLLKQHLKKKSFKKWFACAYRSRIEETKRVLVEANDQLICFFQKKLSKTLTFSSWQTKRSKRHSARGFLQRLCRLLIKRKLRFGWHKFMMHSVMYRVNLLESSRVNLQSKYQKSIVCSVVKTMCRHRKVSVLHAWRCFSLHNRALKTALFSFTTRRKIKCLSTSLHAWYFLYRRKNYQRKQQEFLLRHACIKMTQHAVFNSWKGLHLKRLRFKMSIENFYHIIFRHLKKNTKMAFHRIYKFSQNKALLMLENQFERKLKKGHERIARWAVTSNSMLSLSNIFVRVQRVSFYKAFLVWKNATRQLSRAWKLRENRVTTLSFVIKIFCRHRLSLKLSESFSKWKMLSKCGKEHLRITAAMHGSMGEVHAESFRLKVQRQSILTLWLKTKVINKIYQRWKCFVRKKKETKTAEQNFKLQNHNQDLLVKQYSSQRTVDMLLTRLSSATKSPFEETKHLASMDSLAHELESQVSNLATTASEEARHERDPDFAWARKYAELADNFEKKTNVVLLDEISGDETRNQ